MEPFTISKSEFDEDSYMGRFESMRKTANPLHAFYSNARILKMQELIQNQKKKEEEQFKQTGKREIMMTKE